MYQFKLMPEFWWAVAVAVLTVLFQAAAAFDPAAVGDPRLWVAGVLTGAVRAAGGAALAWLTRPQEPR